VSHGVVEGGAGAADDSRGSRLRWVALSLAALTIFSSYYESDVIGPISDLLFRQRHLSHLQIGDLTAVISLPNIPLALLNGFLIDRYGAARVTLWAAAIGFVGAVLTAIGEPYELMWTGRLVFGVSEGAIFISLVAGVAQWFSRRDVALAIALFLSLARVGSASVDLSTKFAKPLYDAGWQPPLVLGAVIAGAGLVASIVFLMMDSRRPRTVASESQPKLRWADLWTFDWSYWFILGVHVLYAAVFFPFRQTFAIMYLQHAKGLPNDVAGPVNSGVFVTAVFMTAFFGLLADRVGHRALMLVAGTALLPITFVILGATDWSPWLSTALMGVSWALVPAVIWPSTTFLVEPRRLGAALGMIALVQNFGLWASNRAAGWIADMAHASESNPAGYDAMLWYFGLLSLTALSSALLLWRRELGPHGHGLEDVRVERRLSAEAA
jgi:MFS family permease